MIDHLHNSVSVDLDDLTVLILDEADCLLELGFSAEIHELWNKAGCSQRHGNLTQAQCLDSLELFRKQQVDFLIATDVAARTSCALMIPIFVTLCCYVHLVGRTARAGLEGYAVTFVPDNDRSLLKAISCTEKGKGYGRKEISDEGKEEGSGKDKKEKTGISLVDMAYRQEKTVKAKNKALDAGRISKVIGNKPKRPSQKTQSRAEEM
ncbi:hypothetical protein Ddye_030839 [Dipteronia dyeriana]|uniref:Helicase C-terminal domain-containing protein n=1 Tax=Dipteronia dyeriana TaxID=168575 RepID=A0AAD9WMX3_9ROSI|nr:hypothetical protein Ddye_030839 [Dipteronia dyeriana]